MQKHLLLNTTRNHRNDIIGLRAIAIISIILYHIGILSETSTGSNCFLVISGFLITKSIYLSIENNSFSIKNFYISRIKKLFSLTIIISLISLIIGCATMLPNDLENLGASAVATAIFSNNILESFISHSYWAPHNAYKPLMHTWFLGVIFQIYLIYPIIFIFIKKSYKSILYSLVLISLVSMYLYITTNEWGGITYYYIQYRIWEFMVGGIAAIISIKFNQFKIPSFATCILLALLIINICFSHHFLFYKYRVIATVAITAIILIMNNRDKISKLILENKYIQAIGTISFGLFLWHQVIIVYARYIFTDDFNIYIIISIVILSFALAYISYRLIEVHFSHKYSNQTILSTSFVGVILVSTIGIYIYGKGGIIKDCPELGYTYSNPNFNFSIKPRSNINIKYNMDVFKLDKEFEHNDKTKIYIVGNSAGRDWVNVLLYSDNLHNFDISYSETPNINRINQAEYIFVLADSNHDFISTNFYQENLSKIWYIGIKRFCLCNGPFYHKPRNENYYKQRYNINPDISDRNIQLKQKFGNRYIDIIGALIDNRNTLPVFSSDNKFISHDGIHLTPAGAKHVYSALQLYYKSNPLPFL